MLNDDINIFLGTFSYPLTSPSLLKHDYLEEYIQEIQQINQSKNVDYKKAIKDKNTLRGDLTSYLNKKYNIYSLDEVYLLLDKWYLYPNMDENGDLKYWDSSYDLIWDRITKMSTSLVSQRDGRIVYKFWKNSQDEELLGGFSGKNKIYLFHSLNRLMPLDIFIIAYMLQNETEYQRKDMNEALLQLDGNYGNIEVSDELLTGILMKGVAENHLHCSVSGSFLNNWDALMKPLTPSKVIKISKSEFVHMEGSIADELRCMIGIAGYYRTILLAGLVDAGKVVEEYREELNVVQNRFCKGNYANEGSVQVLEWVMNREHQIMENIGFYMDSSGEEKSDTSIIRKIKNIPEELNTSDENIFLYAISKRIREDKNSQNMRFMKYVFLNYLRIKNYIYSVTIQQKQIHGLYSFKNYFANSSKINNMDHLSSEKFWDRVIREQLQNEGLTKLELRMSMMGDEAANEKSIIGFLKAYQKILKDDYCRCEPIECQGKVVKRWVPIRKLPRVGMVAHFTKSEQEYFPEKCIIAGNGLEKVQYGNAYKKYKNELDMFLRIRQKWAGIDKYLLGIDVASLENAIPTWVFTAIYENARDSKIDNLKYYNRSNYQSLGFTIHAGEDFRHILSGLRRIYEAIIGLKFHAGDRIGHGIALGLDPETWHRSNPTVIIPRLEALENYLWAYRLLSRYANGDVYVNIAYLEKKIYQLAKSIWGEKRLITKEILIDAYERLYTQGGFKYVLNSEQTCRVCYEKDNESTICKLAYHDVANEEYAAPTLAWNVEEILMSLHCKYYVHKMNEPIHIRVCNEEIIVAKELQRQVIKCVNDNGIIIEVNPSSNVAISDMDTINQNQVYSINHCEFNYDNVMACINSDDPMVFNTNVCNELGYIYFGMVERGVSRENVLQWIDKLRETGMMASFIRNDETDENIINSLEKMIKEME